MATYNSYSYSRYSSPARSTQNKQNHLRVSRILYNQNTLLKLKAFKSLNKSSNHDLCQERCSNVFTKQKKRGRMINKINQASIPLLCVCIARALRIQEYKRNVSMYRWVWAHRDYHTLQDDICRSIGNFTPFCDLKPSMSTNFTGMNPRTKVLCIRPTTCFALFSPIGLPTFTL